jgi:L-aminopeptidase/D-esterase-like protein
MRPQRHNAITDVPGIRVGQVSRIGDGYLTGVTVVLPPPATVAAVDVRGGGPATHETDALRPGTLVPTADAIVLTGGSAYGLVSAHGAQRWCEQHGRGFPVGGPGDVVPIVPAAAIFDLGRGGRFGARPEADWGYRAARLAWESGDHAPLQRGVVGAGCGALVAERRIKGGLGTASTQLRSGDTTFTVGAIAVVNARGVPQLPELETLLASLEGPADSPARGFNTTIAVIATDARLDVTELTRTSGTAHAGLARAIDPVHTLTDGDTIFGLATGTVPLPDRPRDRVDALVRLEAAAADVIRAAVLDAVRSAGPVRTPAGHFPGLATPTDPADA